MKFARIALLVLIAAALVVPVVCAAPSRIDVLVINARFRNRDPLVADPREMVEKAAAYWREVSYGKLDVRVSYAPLYVIPKDDPGVCDATSWNVEAVQAAVAAGASGNWPVYIIPGCRSAEGNRGFAGVWISNPSWQTVAHELGHTFGLDHAVARRCAAWQQFPPDNCDRIEYGSPLSVMGAGFQHVSVSEKANLGWASGVVRLDRKNGVRSVPLTALEVSDSGSAVSVERYQGGGVYIAERRSAFGFDTGNGIAIYWNQDYVAFSPVGVPWRDPSSGVGFTLSSGGVLDVEIFDGPAPTPTPTAGPSAPTPTQGPVDPGCHLPPEYCAPLRTPTPLPTEPAWTVTLTPTQEPTWTPTAVPPTATPSQPPSPVPSTPSFTPTAEPTLPSPTPTLTSTAHQSPTPSSTTGTNGGGSTDRTTGILGLAALAILTFFRKIVAAGKRFVAWVKAKL